MHVVQRPMKPGSVWIVALLTLVLGPTLAHAQAELPTIERPVTDMVSVLSADGAARITSALEQHRQATGVQMAVVVVRTTGGEPIEDYSMRLATAWGGGDKERDDGVLFLLAVNDRRLRLEVGYGLEPAIPDAAARAILDNSHPHLRSGDYDAAVSSVVDQVIARTAHVKPGKRASAYTPPFGSLVPFAYLFAMLAGLIGGWLCGGTLKRKTLIAADSDDDRPRRGVGCQLRRWLWAGLLPLCAAVTWQGSYHWAYALVLLAGVGVGVGGKLLAEDHLGWVAGFLISLGGIYFVGVATHHDASFDATGVAGLLGQHLLLSLMGMVVWKILVAVVRVGGSSNFSPSSSSSGSSSSWSFSSSSSSWSSSSSSSSTWSAGSSSSWSGGGGSFGGGGASSSW